VRSPNFGLNTLTPVAALRSRSLRVLSITHNSYEERPYRNRNKFFLFGLGLTDHGMTDGRVDNN